jgi:glycosyltransferase involved in cell wall biosynthesis
MWPRTAPGSKVETKTIAKPEDLPFISIIIPARNEEENLKTLLDSLKNIEYPNYEVIVVDDQSEDKTAAIAASYEKVRVIQSQARPGGWLGKNWACQQGGIKALGDVLLFLDADTKLYKDSLSRALSFMRANEADLISPLYFHRCETFWEKLLGPGYFYFVAPLAFFEKPRLKQLFANGQFLFFKKSFYQKIGGHEQVKEEPLEDLAFGQLCVRTNARYFVFTDPALYSVRMYPSFYDLYRGWRRNFRAVFHYITPTAPLEVILMLGPLLGGGLFWKTPLTALSMVLGFSFLLYWQRRLGEFSFWGVLFWPVSFVIFNGIMCFALYDLILNRKLVWKGRQIKV